MYTKVTKIVVLMSIFLFVAGTPVAKSENQQSYINKEIGISFTYPNDLRIDDDKSRKEPLSIVFKYDEPPFAVSILFKELIESGDLNEFIREERNNQEAGGYRDQIKENRYQIGEEITAIEFVRKSEMGEVYYFVFPGLKANKLYAFWHVTSKIADPQENAVRAYKMMIDNLKISH